MQQQLRLDAIDVRRVEKQLKKKLEQRFLNGRRLARFAADVFGSAGQREDIADDRLGVLINAEYVARYLTGLDGRIAR